MTIAKTYAGNLAASFREEDTFWGSLLEREPNARWTLQPIGDLRVVLLAKDEAKMKALGYSHEKEHTHFLPKAKNLALLVRNHLIKVLPSRASAFRW